MKRSIVMLALAAVATVIIGCGPSGVRPVGYQTQNYFKSSLNMDFPPRNVLPEATTESDSGLLAGGYVRIGRLNALHLSKRQRDGKVITSPASRETIRQRLEAITLAAAAKQGGDMVQMKQDSYTNSYQEAEGCDKRKYKQLSQRTYEDYSGRTTTTTYETKCLRVKYVDYSDTYDSVTAHVWRREPEMAARVLNTRRFFSAVSKNDHKAIDKLLPGGLWLEYRDEESKLRPIDYVVKNNKASAMKALIHAGIATPEVLAPDMPDYLNMALAANNMSMVKLLVSQGADVNPPAVKATPLMLAAEGGHLTMVRQLVDLGADVNARSGRATALINAVSSGHNNVAGLLIKKGADVNATPVSGGYTAMNMAAYNGNLKGLRVLLNAGAEAGNTLTYAVDSYNNKVAYPTIVAMVEYLIKAGADVNSRDVFMYTPLMLSAHLKDRKASVKVMKMLLAAGADTRLKDKYGDAAIHEAITSCSGDKDGSKCVELVELLIKAGADVNETDSDRHTPAIVAIMKIDDRKASVQVLRMLIDAGADLRPRDDWGKTALDRARQMKAPEAEAIVMDWLKKNGRK